MSCYRSNSHVGSAVICQLCTQCLSHSSRLICLLMTSSATSRLRLDFHHIKVDLKKTEVIQPLIQMFVRCHLVSTFKPSFLCFASNFHAADKEARSSFSSSNQCEGEGHLSSRPIYSNHSGFGFSCTSYVEQPQLTCHFLLG